LVPQDGILVTPVPHDPRSPDSIAAQPARAALRHLRADACLWLAFLLTLQAFRLVLIFLFRGDLAADTGGSQLLRAVARGFCFDASIATYALLPSVILTAVSFFCRLGKWPSRLRWTTAALLVVSCLFLFMVDVGYLREYHDQFNHWIFGLIFDDRTAIAQTVWKDYPVVWLSLFFLAGSAALILGGRWLWRAILARLRLPARWGHGIGRLVLPLALIGIVVLGLRGSAGRRPIGLLDAAVTRDPFLNKLVMNPFAALKYAIKQHQLLAQAAGLRTVLPDGDIRAALGAVFPQGATVTNLDDALLRTAAGRPGEAPRHVVLIVEESYDCWAMRPENASLQLTTQLQALARRGLAADAFVSSADGTMPSVGAIVTGLPHTAVQVNYQPAARRPFPTSIAPLFKRLGYRTRLFYSGYLSWQRLGDFCLDQGFDEVHGGGAMREQLTGKEWGVDDEDLFQFVLSKMGDQPTFDLLLTTSYHPPYSVDLAAKGFPRQSLQAEFASRGLSEEQIRILGHLWYADHALGKFVEALLQRVPRPLLAITGDHWSRRDYSRQPVLYGRRAVPFVLVGPEVLAAVRRPDRMAGSHNDIAPTLVELCAPRGFTYHSFGRNMLDPSQAPVGFGVGTVITPDFVVDITPPGMAQDMTGRRVDDVVPVADWTLRYQRLHALAWWRVIKGNAL